MCGRKLDNACVQICLTYTFVIVKNEISFRHMSSIYLGVKTSWSQISSFAYEVSTSNRPGVFSIPVQEVSCTNTTYKNKIFIEIDTQFIQIIYLFNDCNPM